MTRTSRTGFVAVAAMALSLAAEMSPCYGDLTLTLQEGGTTLVIDNTSDTTATVTLTGGAVGNHFVSIDGQVVSIADGVTNLGLFLGNGNSAVSFADNSSLFKDYAINGVSASITPGAVESSIFDTALNVKSNVSNPSSLTVTVGNTFAEPNNSPIVNLVSDLASSTVTGSSSQAAFSSSLNGSTTPILVANATGTPSGASSEIYATLPSTLPYLVTNQIVLSGLGTGNAVTLDATTNIVAPDPPRLRWRWRCRSSWRRSSSSKGRRSEPAPRDGSGRSTLRGVGSVSYRPSPLLSVF